MEQAGFLAKKTYEILNGLGQMNIPEKEAITGLTSLIEKRDVMRILDSLTVAQQKLEYNEENRYKKAEIEALAYLLIGYTLED